MIYLKRPFSVRALALAAALLLAEVPAIAVPVRFDIPAQSASSALRLLGQQAGVEVIYPAGELRKLQVKAVKGEMEPAEAFAQLFAGTAYAVRKLTETSYAVEPRAVDQSGVIDGRVQDEAGRGVAGVVVTLAGSEKGTRTDASGHFSMTGVRPGVQTLHLAADGRRNTRVTDVQVRSGQTSSLEAVTMPAQPGGVIQLEDFVVSVKKNDGILELDPFEVSEGRARPFTTANIDLTRTKDDVLPFQSYSAKDVEQSGSADLAEFFRNRLSQNYTRFLQEEALSNGVLSVGHAQNELSLASGAGGGGPLGETELVILVNGRRLPTAQFGNGNSITSSGNFRGIPIASIERIEVLSSAAGAIYGSGATGGVINIITRQDYQGGSIALGFESPVDVMAARRSIDLEYALPVRPGLSLRLAYGYKDNTPLTMADRADETLICWRNTIMSQAPAVITGDSTPLLGATPNIRSLSGANLFGPGTPGFTSVPDGYTGGQGLTPFLARQGVYNTALADGGARGGFGRNSEFGPHSHDRNLVLGFDQTLGSAWRLTAEYSQTTSVLAGRNSDVNTLAYVSAGAPSNPFGQTVVVQWYDPRLDRPELGTESITKQDQFLFSLRGEWHDWRALVDASYSRVVDTYRKVSFVTPLDGSGNMIEFSDAINQGLYNPFVDPRVTAPAAPGFYNEYARLLNLVGGVTDNYQGSAKVSGAIGKLPAGPLQLTLGAEWIRQKRSRTYSLETALNSRTKEVIYNYAEKYDPPFVSTGDTYSLYGEANLPVVAPRQNVPFVRGLEVFTSGRASQQSLDGVQPVSSRFDAYGLDYANVIITRPASYTSRPFLYAAGFRHDLVSGVAYRGSISIGFKPPVFGDVIPSLPATANVTVTDRRTNQTVVLTPAMQRTGGNADLVPETTRSVNWGLILQPKWTDYFRASVDYVESTRNDAITSLTAQTVLDLEATDPQLASRVQRDASGRITLVDSRSINFARIASKTLDITLEQQVPNVWGGRIVFTAAATKNLSFKIQTSAKSQAVEQVENPLGTYGFSFVRWNGNGQVRWEGRRWTVGWSTRYFDDVLVRPVDFAAQGKDRIEWAHEHSAFVSHRFSEKALGGRWGIALKDTTATVGIKNVFDRKPRFQGSNSTTGYYGADSAYGRSFWVQLRRDF